MTPENLFCNDGRSNSVHVLPGEEHLSAGAGQGPGWHGPRPCLDPLLLPQTVPRPLVNDSPTWSLVTSSP